MRHRSPRFNPTYLALAVALALGASGLTQAQTVDDTKTQSLSIEAQSLGSALNELSAATRVPIAFSPALVAGKTGPAIKGDLTPRQAINQLLAGSGLTASQEGGSIVIQVAHAASREATLPAITVKADSDRDGTTEGTGSYKAQYTNTATRLNLSPRETPQTVSVVTRQQMDDFGMTSVDDALEATSGVIVQDRGLNGSNYYSRGFSLQTQYDGIPNPVGISQGNLGPQIDSAFLDRVEVLQGASGLTSGAGYPGGTINLVRKRPTQSFQAQAEAQLGSWNQRRLVADVSGPLAESGRIRGRIVGLADNSDSFVDYVYNHRRGAYGIIEADLTPTTTAFASVQYQEDTGINHLGVPFGPDGRDLRLSRSSFFGNPNSRNAKDNTLYTIGLDQRLASDWNLKISYQRGDVNANQRNYSAVIGVGSLIQLSQVAYVTTQNRYDALDAFFSGPVSLFGRTHELAFGLNGSGYRLESQHSGYVRDTTIISPYQFNPAAVPDAPLGKITLTDNKTTQYGAYGVGRFNLSDSLKLITGVRVSSYELRNQITNTTTQKETSVVSPYAGLIYDLNKQYSAYLSYSDIFQPQSNKSANGDTLKPVVGSNYEAGIKGELLDGKLNVAAAVFRLEQTNLAKIDSAVPYDANGACNGWCYIAADKVVSQGMDLSINGEVRPGWNVFAGYTYVDSEYASGSQKGDRYLTKVPQHSLRFASDYKIPNTKWSVGGDARAYSSIKNSGTTSYVIRQGGTVLFDLHAKYEFGPKTDITLVVNNVFDKRYYTHVESLGGAPYGDPRNFSVNMKLHF